MRKLWVKPIGLAIILLLLGLLFQQANAAKGIPGSQEFAFGAIIFTEQPSLLPNALKLASDLKPDWLYVPVAFADVFPEPDHQNWETLDQVMAVATDYQIAVVIGLSTPPDWAMTVQGPDPSLTAQAAVIIAKRYPKQVQAFELYPRANTRKGWGSQADPAAYFSLFQMVRQAFLNEGLQITLVGGGLQPLPSDPAEGDINDLVFLQGLYDLGAANWMPVISIQLVEVVGEPLSTPVDGEYRNFRHYEKVRKTMVDNRHLNGLLWITHLNLPNGPNDPGGEISKNLHKQAEWLRKAYVLLRSQLYIGCAFLQSLNSPPNPEGMAVMLLPGGSPHPFFTSLKGTVPKNNPAEWFDTPGRPKDGNLRKNR